MATPRTTSSNRKKTNFPPKPSAAQKIAQLDQFVTGGVIEESSTTIEPTLELTLEPMENSTVKTTDIEVPIVNSTNEFEKAKMKRLTLDISEDLHKSIKMKSVSLGIPMVDMLRTLLDSNYGNS